MYPAIDNRTVERMEKRGGGEKEGEEKFYLHLYQILLTLILTSLLDIHNINNGTKLL